MIIVKGEPPIITSGARPEHFSSLEDHLRACALTRPAQTRASLVIRYTRDASAQHLTMMRIAKLNRPGTT